MNRRNLITGTASLGALALIPPILIPDPVRFYSSLEIHPDRLDEGIDFLKSFLTHNRWSDIEVRAAPEPGVHIWQWDKSVTTEQILDNSYDATVPPGGWNFYPDWQRYGVFVHSKDPLSWDWKAAFYTFSPQNHWSNSVGYGWSDHPDFIARMNQDTADWRVVPYQV